MNTYIKNILLICTVASQVLMASDNESKTKFSDFSLGQIFEEGKVSGNLRSIYTGYSKKEQGEKDGYATAVGGHIKYETAELSGFNAAAAFATSHDIGFATGEKGVKQNEELSSSQGKYTTLSEAYVNYTYDDFNFRAGRQLIDTPLADSDDIRMIFNTFEAFIATYKTSYFNFITGKLQKWQGYDAGLDDSWVKTGEDGTYFSGIVYSDNMMEANAWYYNITKFVNAAYFDATLSYEINDDCSVLGAVQYVRESEIDNSGVEASIYGLKTETALYGFTLSVAYNKSQKKSEKSSFSGFGGGALFTNMDTMILNEITNDRNARAVVGGISYVIDDLTLSYAYGDFKGKADSLGNKANIAEQNIKAEYSVIADRFTLSAIYAIEKDKEVSVKNENDWSRLQITASYNF